MLIMPDSETSLEFHCYSKNRFLLHHGKHNSINELRIQNQYFEHKQGSSCENMNSIVASEDKDTNFLQRDRTQILGVKNENTIIWEIDNKKEVSKYCVNCENISCSHIIIKNTKPKLKIVRNSESLKNNSYPSDFLQVYEYGSHSNCCCQNLPSQPTGKLPNDLHHSPTVNETCSVIVKNDERVHDSFASTSQLDSCETNTDINFGFNSFQSIISESNDEILTHNNFNHSSAYATLTPLQPLPPISTMSEKFAYGGNISACNDTNIINGIEQSIINVETNKSLDCDNATGSVPLKHLRNIHPIHDLNHQRSLIVNDGQYLKTLTSKSDRQTHTTETYDVRPEAFNLAYTRSPMSTISSEKMSSPSLSDYDHSTDSKAKAVSKRCINDLPFSTFPLQISSQALNEYCHVITDGLAITSEFDYNNPIIQSTVSETPNIACKSTCIPQVGNDEIGNNSLPEEHEIGASMPRKTCLGVLSSPKSSPYITLLDVSLRKTDISQNLLSNVNEVVPLNKRQDLTEIKNRDGDELYMLHSVQSPHSEHKKPIRSTKSSKKVIFPHQTQQLMEIMSTSKKDRTTILNCNDLEEINTKDLAQCISSELKRYSIPQAVFAQRVLCRSQGTLSDLLRNPKPWSKLKSGRETFRRMLKWLQGPEFQRMSTLRIGAVQMPQTYGAEVCSQTICVGNAPGKCSISLNN